jgi:hypothetical protein
MLLKGYRKEVIFASVMLHTKCEKEGNLALELEEGWRGLLLYDDQGGFAGRVCQRVPWSCAEGL